MKKCSLIILLTCLMVLLVACSSRADLTWLKGRWYSKDWQVTYTFKETKEHWSIYNSDEAVAESATLKQKDIKTVELTDTDGTHFIIEKVNDRKMYFQQFSKEGLLGTTASVVFEKEE